MTSRPTAFMPLWIGDYLADTTHLTTEQHGAYLLLLMAYWRRGGPLPADDAYLCRIAGMTIYKWRGTRPTIAAFFEERDGIWVSKRSDEELVKAEVRYGKRAAAGRKGGSAPKVSGRKIVYAPALATSSALPIAANEAEKVETAETSHQERSNASPVLEAVLKQSQSQPQKKRTGTLSSSSQPSEDSEAKASEPSGSFSFINDHAAPEIEQEPASKPSAPAPVGGLVDFKKELWGRGVAYLTANGASDSHARSQIGKWRKLTGSDFEVIQLLAKAEAEAVSEPMAFIEGTLNAQKVKTNGQSNGRSTGQPGNPGAVASVFIERYKRNRAARVEREGTAH